MEGLKVKSILDKKVNYCVKFIISVWMPASNSFSLDNWILHITVLYVNVVKVLHVNILI